MIPVAGFEPAGGTSTSEYYVTVTVPVTVTVTRGRPGSAEAAAKLVEQPS